MNQIGIDVSNEVFDTAMFFDGKVVRRQFTNTPSGHHQFMPALVAIQHDANVSAYYKKLLRRGKPKMVAITAVMRKLLHALWAMLYYREEWDGNKFYRMSQIESA